MKSQSTLVLLGLNTQKEVQEETVRDLIVRLTPTIERSVRSLTNHVFVMLDQTIPKGLADTIRNNFPKTPFVSHEFVDNLNEGQKETLPRVYAHFDRHPQSVLMLITERSAGRKTGIAGHIREATSPKFLDIITI